MSLVPGKRYKPLTFAILAMLIIIGPGKISFPHIIQIASILLAALAAPYYTL